MNDELIRFAIEAGFEHDPADGNNIYFSDGYWTKELARFAALVAAAEREACKQWFIEDSERFAAQVALAEREACAKVCDARCIADGWEGCYADECAAAIRARGNT
jgi:hypothetical protein